MTETRDLLDMQCNARRPHPVAAGARCILDPNHGTSKHWGPDTTGRYVEWANTDRSDR